MTPLRTLREKFRLSQEKLGKKIHVSQSRIMVFESGRERPWPHEANALADFFGIEVATLFPDGLKERCDYGKNTKAEREYLPPDESAPVIPRVERHYPREFTVLCYRCHKHVPMRADDCHTPEDEDPRCPECGARFYQIVPLQEATI